MTITLRRKSKRDESPKWDVYTPLWGGWNYPKPIISGEWTSIYPPDDGDLKHLLFMADSGWFYYQKAFVEMRLICPLADYKPAVIYDEFRESFEANYEDKPMPLLLYEKDGKLITSNDWEAYWLYREREESSIPCILIGHFTEQPGIGVCDRPFLKVRPDKLLSTFEPLCTW